MSELFSFRPMESELDGEDEDMSRSGAILTIVLTSLYFILCVTAAVKLFRIFYYRHNQRSFHFGFLVLVFFWTALRVIFFGETSSWKPVLSLLFFWLPVDLQFATFSLLIVYYAFLLHRRTWKHKRVSVLTLYGFANVGAVLLTCVYIYLACRRDGECEVTEGLDNAHHAYMTVQLLALVVVYCKYCLHLYSVKDLSLSYAFQGHVPTAPETPRSKPVASYKLFVLTLTVGLIFTSRCVYNILATLGVYQMYVGNADGHIRRIKPLIFALLFVWEIIPTVMVLIYFRVPSTNLGGFCINGSTRHNDAISPNQYGSVGQTPILSGPHRYLDGSPRFDPADSDLSNSHNSAIQEILRADTPQMRSAMSNAFANPLRYDTDSDEDDDLGFPRRKLEYGV